MPYQAVSRARTARGGARREQRGLARADAGLAVDAIELAAGRDEQVVKSRACATTYGTGLRRGAHPRAGGGAVCGAKGS